MGDLPFSRIGNIIDLNLTAQIAGGIKGFVHELLNIAFIQPCSTEPYFDLACFKVFRLCRGQSFHVPGEEWITVCG